MVGSGGYAVDIGDAIVQVVEKAKAHTVHVRAIQSDGETVTLGSGVVFDHSHVLTTAQVVGGGEKEITVRTFNGRQYNGTVVGVDPLYFVTVLEIDGWMPIDPPVIRPSDAVPLGLPVVAMGNATGHSYSATFGIVSGVDRTIYRPERLPVDGLIITDARIHPGNAGGALVDLEGRLVGVNGIPWQHGLSLALHADVVWRLVNQIIDYGYATHAWLGFSGEPEVIDKAVADLFSLPVQEGVTVAYVAADGPGAAAGVQVGDMVVRIKDQQVSSLGTIRRVLSLHRHGERVPMTVLRGGKLQELHFPVIEMPRLGERGRGQ